MKKRVLFIFMSLLLTLGLVACDKGPSASEKASFEALYKAININVTDPTNIINSFEVPVSGREEGSTVTWKSTNEAVAVFQVVGGQNQITVTRPAEGQANAEFKLVATVKWTAPSKHEFSQEKEFEVRVIAFPVAESATLKDLRDGKYSTNDAVKVKNVIVVHVSDTGYSVIDDTTGIFVYTKTTPNVTVGDKGEINAKYGVNFDSPQLNDATFTKASSLTHEQVLALAVEKNVEDFWIQPYNVANDTDGAGEKREKAAKASSDLNKLVKFEGTVKIESSWSGDTKYKTVIYGTDGTKYIRSYYGGLKHAAVNSIDGLPATFYAIPYTVRNDRPQPKDIGAGLSVPTFEFFIIDFVLGELTDEQSVQVDTKAITVDSKIREEKTITLPKLGEKGSTITWASNDAAINVETGKVTVTPDVQKEVKLTATITKNDATETKEFTVLVGIPAVSTIADAAKLAKDKDVKVVGVITRLLTSSKFGNSTVYIKDETGAISLFRVSKDYTSILKVGQEISVLGVISENNSKIKEISNAIITVTDTPIQTVTPVNKTTALVKADVNQFVSVSGYLKNVYTDGDTFELYFNDVEYVIALSSLDDLGEAERTALITQLKTYAIGDLVTVTSTVQYVNDVARVIVLAKEDVVKGTAVPADLKNTASENLDLPKGADAVFTDLELPTTAGFGTVITWTSGNTTVIANDGKVTRPAEGQPSATVAMTYIIKLGEEQLATASVNFVVRAVGDDITTLYTFDFGTVAKTGYGEATDFEYTNTDGAKINTSKDRAQTNVSTFEPHVDKGAMLVLAPTKAKTFSFFEFDLTKYSKIKKIEFSFSAWNQNNVSKIKGKEFSLSIEVYNSETKQWDKVKAENEAVNFIDEITANEYVTVKLDTTVAGKYRIVYEAATATTSGNTDIAICVDNFKILG